MPGMDVGLRLCDSVEDKEVLEADFSLVEVERGVYEERCFLSLSLSFSLLISRSRSRSRSLSLSSGRSGRSLLDSLFSLLLSGLLSLGRVGGIVGVPHGADYRWSWVAGRRLRRAAT